MNEWKSCFFLFPVCFFFFSAPKIWMNEWPKMTFELFRGKKKKQKTHTKMREKKKHNQVLLKKLERHQNLIEWPMNFSWEIKKNKLYFFFPASREKKNTIFGFEWMNDQRPCPRKKKKYGTFGRAYLVFVQYLLEI